MSEGFAMSTGDVGTNCARRGRPHDSCAPSAPDVDHDLPLARPVALDQRQALPRPQQEPSVTDGNGLRWPQHRRFEMRGAVVVDLVVLPDALRKQLVEGGEDIRSETRVG